ncbi:hypothetical protein MNBD_GAMMA06-741 [hydrothermal vent metagenome]|uniref:Uncharacterized protein n=1 Tax=hydrothermal vent metagenome TaxID=652676 RepID=A0A3B0WMF6_9ZZZZ
MEKKQILQQALKRLNTQLTTQLTTEKNLTLTGNLFVASGCTQNNNDGLAKISSNSLGQSYTVLLQPWAPQKDISALISQIKSFSSPTILFADFINPVMAEKFRRRSISFVDCAGNLSIKNTQFNLQVKGKKSSQLRSKRIRGRAFNSAGLKLIFALFNKPQLLHASYRDISKRVNIALGSVGPVIDDLYASGYIFDDGERRLVNKKRLFERWVDGYLEKLRPKQIMSCYTADDENWWKKANPTEFHGLWGGEVIIAKSTPFIMPETISLYFSSEKKQKAFADFCGLHEDPEGEICMYKSFWQTNKVNDGTTNNLSPMIVYADIVDAINPGSWDVAKTFYGEAIAHLLHD